MKINDIITEGPVWDGIKGAWAGAKAGYQQSKQQAASDASAKEMAQRFTTQWLTIAKNNPAATAADLQAFVQKLNIGTPIPQYKGAINDPAGVEKYIAQSFAMAEIPTTAAPADAQQTNQSYAGASPSYGSEKISIGGQELDPNDPANAAIIAQLNKQSAPATQPAAVTPTPAAAPAQTPEQIRAAKQAAAAAAAQAQMTPKPAPTPNFTQGNYGPTTYSSLPASGPSTAAQVPAAATPVPANANFAQGKYKPATTNAPLQQAPAKKQPAKDELGRIEPTMAESKIDIAETLWRKMKRIK
jgi:hypothetical protein